MLTPPPRKNTLGYSLLEMVITLAVAAILLSIGLPSFTEQIEEQRNEQVINRLYTILQQTRHRAVSQKQPTTLCKTADFSTCGGDWGQGILIFTDQNLDGRRDDNETIHLTVNDLFDEGNLHWRSFGNKRYLQFLPTGSTNYQNGTFTYCDKDNDLKKARGISITVTGRTQIAFDRNGDGVRENASGRPLRC
ncbi:MAG: hypothetical protein AseanaTS_25890 [Candidatus Pelagadaptatus aseana]|uniref:GspH/FimT family pseudopilin n=1 Tax=Candidatus Pelagadaptatus aseana TaxID=3120508 RepID=UPI0039B2700D